MIKVEALSKEFGYFKAVDAVSFEVPKGQILGFLGPNGAGKSTTMKMLTGFIAPTSGTATVSGHDIVADSLAVKRMIGCLPESAPSYGEMTVVEFLTFIAEMRDLKGEKGKQAAEKMRDICFLSGVWHQPIETLSKGYKQRVGFAQALIHDPPVLILDEPTDGLDPNQKHEVRELIKRMGQDKTIILSTHILEEVEAICERVIIIANGKMVSDATPEDLLQKARVHNAVTIDFVSPPPSTAIEVLKGVNGVLDVEDAPDGKGYRCYANQGRNIIDNIAKEINDNGWRVKKMQQEQGKLDEVFRKVTLGH